MADGKVIIEIDAQDSGFLQKLQAIGSAAESLSGGPLQNLDHWLQENQISAQAWSQMVYNATTTVLNSFSALDTSLGIDLHDMAANLEENIAAYNNWNTNLQTLMAAAVATGSQASVDFVLYMQDMGIGAADQVQQMVDNIDYTMSIFPPLMSQAMEAGMTGVQSQVERSKSGVASATQNVMDGASGVIARTDLKSAATTAGSGISPGLRSQTGAVSAASQSLITAIITLWNAAAGQFQSAGQQAGQHLNTGLLNGKAALGSTASSLSSSVITAFTSAAGAYHTAGLSAAQSLAGGIAAGQSGVAQAAMAGAQQGYSMVGSLGWYSLGYNISSGIASGVSGGSYLITSAARSAANSALASAKSALGIHSPSRVFRDQVGRMIPSGIALGIQNATPEAQDAVTVSADKLLSSARAAVRPTVDEAARSYVTQNTVYHNGGAEALCLTVPLTVDGREFARATAKYTGRQMAYLEV